MHYNNFGLF